MSDPRERRRRARRFERVVQVVVFFVGALVLGRELLASAETRFERLDGHRVVLDLPVGSIAESSQMSWHPRSRGSYAPDGLVVLGAETASVEVAGAAITSIRAPMRVHLEEGRRPRVVVLLDEAPTSGRDDREIAPQEPLRLTHRHLILDVVAAGRVSLYPDSTVIRVDAPR